MNDIFRVFAKVTSKLVGSSTAFVVALLIIGIWAASGSFFGYSDTWQLFINTFTTVTTFLIVILIQNTQNRENKAVNLKLNELVKSVKGASNSLIDSEELSDEDLEALHENYRKLHERYEDELEARRKKRVENKKLS